MLQKKKKRHACTFCVTYGCLKQNAKVHAAKLYNLDSTIYTRGGGVKKKREDVRGGQGRGEREERGDRRWEILGEKGRVELVGGEKGCKGNSRRGGREC